MEDSTIAMLEALQKKTLPFRKNLGQSEVIIFLHAARKFRASWNKSPLSPNVKGALPSQKSLAQGIRSVHKAMHDFIETLRPKATDDGELLKVQADGLRKKEAELATREAQLEKREKALGEAEKRQQRERNLQEERTSSEQLSLERFKTSEDLIDLLGDTNPEPRGDCTGHSELTNRMTAKTAQTFESNVLDECGLDAGEKRQEEDLKKLEEENAKLRKGLQLVIEANSQLPLIAQHNELRKMILHHRRTQGRAGAEIPDMQHSGSDNDQNELSHLVNWLMVDQTYAIEKQRTEGHKAKILEELYEKLHDRFEECIASKSRDAGNIKAFLLDTEDCGSPHHLMLKRIFLQHKLDMFSQREAMGSIAKKRGT